MKKLCLFVLLIIVWSLYSAPVSVELIEKAAGNICWERTGEHQEIISVMPLMAGEQTVMYAVNYKNGFVIISSHDIAYPVWGYSFEGSLHLEDMPPQMRAVLNWQKQEILSAVERGDEALDFISEEWQRLTADNFTPERDLRNVSPLLSTNWNQGQYYNEYCPEDSEGPDGHVWAGCVATAMAQVMKYYSYPAEGTGSHSYYHWEYGYQSANFAATDYNWSAMPNNVTSYNSEVATLFYHLGVAVDMDYGVNGSGAYSGDARDALVEYFQYQSSAALLFKDNYTDATWAGMVRTELDNGRPLYYRGQNYTSGHAFNLDGYQGSDHFHFNWGWSGYNNGYFYLNDLTPGNGSYSLEQAAIFYLQPSLDPQITVLTPNGGESYDLGEDINISWESQDIGNNVSVILYAGNALDLVISPQTVNDGTFIWTIPANFSIGDNYKIKIMDSAANSVYDYSDEYFSLADPVAGELENVLITISDAQVVQNDNFDIAIYTSELDLQWNLISYQFSLLYDESIMEYTGYSSGDFMGNILAYEGTAGHIDVAYANAMPISGAGNLIVLHFEAVSPGQDSLFIPDFRYNTYEINNIQQGIVNIEEFDPYAGVNITAGTASGAVGELISLPVNTSLLTTEMGAISFQFDMHYDNTLLSFDSAVLGDVPNPANFVANEAIDGVVSVAYANVMPISGEGELCSLNFMANAAGTSLMEVENFKYNSMYIDDLSDGEIVVSDVQYPQWSVNPPDYEYNGSLWGIVMLDDVEVDITSGMLGCFVNEECRGIASLEQGSLIDYTIPFGHIIFLPMIYSNVTAGETIDFLYFDAESEDIYPIAETVTWEADMVIGNGYDPFVLHASTITTIDISKEMVSGWNWFSLNVTGEDMGINSVLSSLDNHGANVKSQTQSAIYYDGMGWFGSLNTINTTTFYKLEANDNATWEYSGVPVDINANIYALTSGWNWISYAPQYAEQINFAFAELQHGMNIKNQMQSAIYYDGMGWFGSLNTLYPLAGYMIQMNDAEAFNYPAPENTRHAEDIISIEPVEIRDPSWMINPPDYEYNGFIWGVVEIDGVPCDDINDMIGVFVDNECRGIALSENNSVHDYTEPFGHIAFMPMVYSNYVDGETLTFEFYDASEDVVYVLEQTLPWEADMTVGSGLEPYIFTVNTNGTQNTELPASFIKACYPNPFNPSVTISFSLQQQEFTDLGIYNLKGQKIAVLCADILQPGEHIRIWDGKDDKGNIQPNGVYFYRLTTENCSSTGKMIMLK